MYFDCPDDLDLIVLWKDGRARELGHFDIKEAKQLLVSLTKAIKKAERNSK